MPMSAMWRNFCLIFRAGRARRGSRRWGHADRCRSEPGVDLEIDRIRFGAWLGVWTKKRPARIGSSPDGFRHPIIAEVVDFGLAALAMRPSNTSSWVVGWSAK